MMLRWAGAEEHNLPGSYAGGKPRAVDDATSFYVQRAENGQQKSSSRSSSSSSSSSIRTSSISMIATAKNTFSMAWAQQVKLGKARCCRRTHNEQLQLLKAYVHILTCGNISIDIPRGARSYSGQFTNWCVYNRSVGKVPKHATSRLPSLLLVRAGRGRYTKHWQTHKQKCTMRCTSSTA
jgi:hypothetical protein